MRGRTMRGRTMRGIMFLVMLCLGFVSMAYAEPFIDKLTQPIKTISNIGDKSKPRAVTHTESGTKRALDVNVTGGTAPEANTAGATTQFEAQTAGVGVVSYPSSEGEDITSFILINQETKIANSVDFSLDSGVTYTEIKGGGFIGWSPKGSVKQIFVRRGGTTDSDFELIINTKAP